MLNIKAPIIPGKSVAGFELGDSLSKVLENLDSVKEWNGVPVLMEAIKSIEGWLLVPNSLLYNHARPGCSLHSPRDVVELHFNSLEKLSSISVFAGYEGTLFDVIQIGSPLSSLQSYIATEYDIGDELHFPTSSNGATGIAFFADESPLSKSPDQIIRGISIFSTL